MGISRTTEGRIAHPVLENSCPALGKQKREIKKPVLAECPEGMAGLCVQSSVASEGYLLLLPVKTGEVGEAFWMRWDLNWTSGI